MGDATMRMGRFASEPPRHVRRELIFRKAE
jgi:hypothetical protein